MTRLVLLRITLVACCFGVAAGAAAQDPHAEHQQPAKPATKPETAKPQPPKPQSAKPQPSKPQPQSANPQPTSPKPAAKEAPATEDHSAHMAQGTEAPKEPIPPLTDADRAAAFPNLEGHAVHDNGMNYFVLFDQFEWRPNENGGGVNWDNKGWIGQDVNRMWFRTEGETSQSDVEHAEAHLFYGRAIARWWDLVAGIRQDFRPGPGRTYAAFGIQGLAPYWFEIEATGYVGEGGRTHARFEAEYELLLTNRFVAQPLVELELYSRSDPERGIGAGLSSAELGARFRYEIRRELAPYVGLTWDRKFGETRDLVRAAGGEPASVRLVVGLRAWF